MALHSRRPRPSPRLVSAWPLGAAFVALVGGQVAAYRLVRAKGVALSGDEPHYLVVARALSQFSVHPFHAYQSDVSTHRLYAWPAGSPLTNLNLHLYQGPHGPVSTHGLGLSALLAPFVAVGGRTLAVLGLMAIEALGFIYFFVRASNLAGLGRPGRAVFALALAAPAMWVASTQVYPDLLTGTLIACALVDVVSVERGRGLDGLAVAVSGLSIGLLPWLHSKNLVPAALILAALVVVGVRHGQRRQLLITAAIVAVFWLLQLGYNLYDFGRVLGLPQPFPSPSRPGWTLIFGIVFDRHQGLFVQVPTVVIGLAGLWAARRQFKVATTATILAAGSVVYLNGTFFHAPYGGTSPAGRFGWSALIPLMLWCPFVLVSLARSAVKLWSLAGAVAVLWLLQGIPILRGQHIYFNQMASGLPWDPSAYPGWWWRLDRVLPEFSPAGHLFGVPWYGLPLELVLLAGATAGLVWWSGRPEPAWLRVGALAGLAVVVVAAVAVAGPEPLPSGPRSFTGSDVGSPLSAAPAGSQSPVVPLQGVGRGTFRITVDYTLRGTQGVFTSVCSSKPPQTFLPGQAAAPGTHSQDITVKCGGGTLWFFMSAGPGTSLAVRDLVVAKTSVD